MSEKEKNKIERIQLTKNAYAEINKETGLANFVNNEEIRGVDNIGMVEFFSEQMNLPIFKGEVEHAYESEFLGYTDKCPRCKSATQNMISNFAYGTQAESRLMTGPAGHFCPNCPTVIIDDNLVRAAISGPYNYHGVFTIETGYSDPNKPALFATLNGEKTVYILDENGGGVGIAQSVHRDDSALFIDSLTLNKLKQQAVIKQQRKKSTNKRKNKNAKKARRRNRKR